MTKKENTSKTLVDRLNDRKVIVKFDARNLLQLYEAGANNSTIYMGHSKAGITDLFTYWLDNKYKTIVACVEGWNKDKSSKELAYFDTSKNKWNKYDFPERPVIEKKVVSSSLKKKRKSRKKKK